MKKQGKNIFILIIAGILIWLLLDKCSGKKGQVVIKETIKIDTAWVTIKGDTSYVPVIKNHYLPSENIIFEKWDTLYQLEYVDTAEILKDYFSFNTYSDTLKNQYGYILVDDTISRNQILSRGVKTDLKVPEVTKTITRTILDKRVQLYAAFGLLGNSKDLASGAELEFLLKTKNDRMVGLGYEKLFNGEGYWKIKYAHKISFKKK